MSSLTTRLATLLATWFGCGLAPAAPGTAGSLGGLAVALLVEHHHHWGPLGWGAFALAMTPLGIWAAGRHASDRGLKDPGAVVVDEVLGQWLTLAGAAQLGGWKPWVAAFVLFRAFDIAKPFPVRKLESLPGGTGIVLDDLGAGLYGAAVMVLLAQAGVI